MINADADAGSRTPWVRSQRGWLLRTNALLCAIPLVTGVVTLLGVADPLYNPLSLPRSPLLDGNLRFFGGVWLWLGFSLARLLPKIESRSAEYRLIWSAVFVGGLGRLLSAAFVGMPPWPFVGFTMLELVGAPLMILWQRSVAMREFAS